MAKLCHVWGLLGILGDLNAWLPIYLDLAYPMPTTIVDTMKPRSVIWPPLPVVYDASALKGGTHQRRVRETGASTRQAESQVRPKRPDIHVCAGVGRRGTQQHARARAFDEGWDLGDYA